MNSKWRSRRFTLALIALLTPCAALLGGVVAMVLGQPITGLGDALGGYALAAGLVLSGYGFTRSRLGGGQEEVQ